MIDPAASFLNVGASRMGQPRSDTRPVLAIGRMTKGVATTIGQSLAVDRDAALPDTLPSLVERLQAGPLGQTQLRPRRVA